MSETLRVLLAILAVWRVTHLLVREDGPWDALRALRRAASRLGNGRLASCFYCLSLWMALPCVWFLHGSMVERIVGWWAVSGGAILLERLTAPPIEIDVEDEPSGMLRKDDRTSHNQPV